MTDSAVAGSNGLKVKVSAEWGKKLAISRTEASMQVIPNAMARRGGPLNEVTLRGVKDLDAQYVRFLPWGPYPRLQIAALEAPTKENTSWDFSFIDPEVIDFLEATKGRNPIVNFSSIPAWMWKRAKPSHPAGNVDKMDWGWGGEADGVFDPSAPQLADPSGRQLADYYARIVSWYTQGGFTDENGKRHESGYRYELPWWGVLNEHDYLGAKQYTILYDAIASAIRNVSPNTRFVGLEFSGAPLPARADSEFVEYFLNPDNHSPGISVEMIACHFYAYALESQTDVIEACQYSFFDQADGFLAQVSVMDAIRRRLSPATLIYPSELGSMLPCDLASVADAEAHKPVIPAGYWNLSAALYAYLYLGFTKLGVEVVGQAGFSFYPGNFPGVSMVNWETGALNARYHVLKLIRDHLAVGDQLVLTAYGAFPTLTDIAAQAFETSKGRRLLLINKRARAVDVELDGEMLATGMHVVDEKSGDNPARTELIRGKSLRLERFAVAVLFE